VLLLVLAAMLVGFDAGRASTVTKPLTCQEIVSKFIAAHRGVWEQANSPGIRCINNAGAPSGRHFPLDNHIEVNEALSPTAQTADISNEARWRHTVAHETGHAWAWAQGITTPDAATDTLHWNDYATLRGFVTPNWRYASEDYAEVFAYWLGLYAKGCYNVAPYCFHPGGVPTHAELSALHDMGWLPARSS
jgi:hypothetical protein